MEGSASIIVMQERTQEGEAFLRAGGKVFRAMELNGRHSRQHKQ